MIIQITNSISDDIIEGLCRTLVHHNLVSKEKTRAMMPADFPYNNWFHRFGVVVRYGKQEGPKRGFVLFEFVTPDDLHVNRFEIELRKILGGGRKYLQERFVLLQQGLDQVRAAKMDQTGYEIVGQPGRAPVNGVDFLGLEAAKYADADSRH